MNSRILVVDDEVGMQVALREVLQRQDYEVTVAPDAMTALQHLDEESFDLILTDVRMPEVTGLDLLDRVRARWPETPVVIMTAYGTIEDAVDAMKKGAADYLLKPFSSEAVEEIVARELERSRSATPEEVEALDDDDAAEPGGDYGSPADPIAVNQSMRQLLALASEVADSMATVLVQGESGTGKEVLARYLHHRSGRRDKPFVAVNCAALPEGLLESELFGHEKGAFTGAVLSRKGKFELANHGTLLLDEVSEMPQALQAKLLRVLQEREIDPVGAQKPVSVDVRVVATTNRDLARYVEEGNFREDLYYRLQVITLHLPPLRERPEDIVPLSEFFVRRLCRLNRRPRKKLGEAMRRYLMEQPWRGNVRELENFLERAVLLCKDEELHPEKIFLGPRFGQPTPANAPVTREIRSEDLSDGFEAPERPTIGGASRPAADPVLAPGELVTLEEMERRLILKTLDRVGGNRTRAADLLGVSVRTVRNKLNQYAREGRGWEDPETVCAK